MSVITVTGPAALINPNKSSFVITDTDPASLVVGDDELVIYIGRQLETLHIFSMIQEAAVNALDAIKEASLQPGAGEVIKATSVWDVQKNHKSNVVVTMGAYTAPDLLSVTVFVGPVFLTPPEVGAYNYGQVSKIGLRAMEAWREQVAKKAA